MRSPRRRRFSAPAGIRGFSQSAWPPWSIRRRGGPLSSRELVVLRLLGGALTERDIARELYLSHNTIHSHTRSIYRKLGASSRSEALAHARELGLIQR